jgi:GNAT superfamily N-acetyltransferase
MEQNPVDPALRPACPGDAADCVRLRGLTRENAVSEARLRAYGITVESWAADIARGALCGWVAVQQGQLQGYAFGDIASGEVVVLALLPQAEGRGLGRRLLALVVQELHRRGHRRLFLGTTADPALRAYGFYRHLGWQGTGRVDARGDEVLELCID